MSERWADAGMARAAVISAIELLAPTAGAELVRSLTMMLLLQAASVRDRKPKTREDEPRDRVRTVSPSHAPRTAVRLWAAISSWSGVGKALSPSVARGFRAASPRRPPLVPT
jgi:hypothetical protein